MAARRAKSSAPDRRRKDPLAPLRARIDALDDSLERQLLERAGLVLEVARSKRESGSNHFYRPEREAQILRRLQAQNAGPLPDEAVLRIFREIMSSCLALEAETKVAYLGPAGTYSESAVLRHFGSAASLSGLSSIPEVFAAVEGGDAHFGVVPVENSTEGGITHTLDMFLESPLRICGEIELRIRHQLLSRAPRLGAVRAVVAHPQALAQCRGWLDRHLPGVAREPVASNAVAAGHALKDARVAAIAGQRAAELFRLPVLKAHIEDRRDNTTRFIVIGDLDPPPSGADRTGLLLSGQNRPGALSRLLRPLERHGINMTRIESRPSRTARWEYVFFLDIDGHARDPKVARALDALRKEAALFRWLGSWPRAVG